MSGSVAVISTALALLLFIPQARVSDEAAGASSRSSRAAHRPHPKDRRHTSAATTDAAANSSGRGRATKEPRAPLALTYVRTSEPASARGTTIPSTPLSRDRGTASRIRTPAAQGTTTPTRAKPPPEVRILTASESAYPSLSNGDSSRITTGVVSGLRSVEASTRPTMVG
ncbi:hypothetical protein GCM10010339_38050 [Streptomyces alanosinicus]|uniref:Secreted protein n=1 Tax=Streptomyces alanosinicus TaxID=68171 RepID=A0A918YJW1_9ACTN|nr:hypothetical protein GCM10010339_38050 [Streptomyces alanosinicus]